MIFVVAQKSTTGLSAYPVGNFQRAPRLYIFPNNLFIRSFLLELEYFIRAQDHTMSL